VSLDVKLLIRALLIRDPLKRLGSQRGAYDVKSHPFFRDIKWPLIRNMVRICPVLDIHTRLDLELRQHMVVCVFPQSSTIDQCNFLNSMSCVFCGCLCPTDTSPSRRPFEYHVDLARDGGQRRGA
jgi:hypothetical protein